MKIRKEIDLEYPILLEATSSLSVSFDDEVICTIPVGNPMTVNRVVIYEIQDQFGFKTGFAAMVGEKQ